MTDNNDMTDPETQRTVDRETFKTLADEYKTASWAVWSDDFPGERCVEKCPEDVREFLASARQQGVLNPCVIFVGLNPGGEILAPLSNFHGCGQTMSDGGKYGLYDRRLKEYIQDAGLSALTGGYMTDVSAVEEIEARNVTVTDAAAERFADQLRILNQDRYTVIVFGNDAFDALANYTGADETNGPVSLRKFTTTIADRPVRVFRVYHYSYQYGGDIITKLRTQLAYIAGVQTDGHTDADE